MIARIFIWNLLCRLTFVGVAQCERRNAQRRQDESAVDWAVSERSKLEKNSHYLSIAPVVHSRLEWENPCMDWISSSSRPPCCALFLALFGLLILCRPSSAPKDRTSCALYTAAGNGQRYGDRIRERKLPFCRCRTLIPVESGKCARAHSREKRCSGGDSFRSRAERPQPKLVSAGRAQPYRRLDGSPPQV